MKNNKIVSDEKQKDLSRSATECNRFFLGPNLIVPPNPAAKQTRTTAE